MTQQDEDADIVRFGDIEIRYLVDNTGKPDSGMLEMTVPPGAGMPPPRRPHNVDEVLYVIAGRLRYCADGVERELGPGDTAVTHAGAITSLSNPYAEPARTLVVLTPDLGPDYFRCAARAAEREKRAVFHRAMREACRR